MKIKLRQLLVAGVFAALTAAPAVNAADIKLLNVSYDPTREFYKEYNEAFSKYWKAKTGDNVTINQSHGGGGKQARAVLDGLEADVVTLAIAYDIDQLYQKRKLISEDWQSQLPNNSSPYTSTIVYVVRKGNPLGIKDWNDLVKPGVGVITPNPKTSGGARWNYVSAWAYALKHNNNNEQAATEFISKLFKNTAVLDTGARGSTTTFAEREIGDVLITWENEAYLVLKEFGADKYEVVTPSFSVLTEPPVTVVEDVARKHGTVEVATEYLKYLYSKEGQEIIGKNYYRPSDPEVAAKFSKQFPKLELFKIDQLGGWNEVQKKHFADGGVFDQIYGPGK
ncbi:MAG: sulfate ABC transporter substrate-binding protein [Methylococcaceae bacterium]|nr:sulfate ABC transporter substrate-binding protein [Methylococcaceae bacterium]MDP2395145.1 sulfate ABC transporter substrate-binding protein [Methylococcaceae bacterium]MDP3018713.1 sulfate ABC transporter substrate-binding protein [Methylococcaceae bacterium]MDP3388907.1 sulfate ABC transporter substrate-binding protein [Methylococcaceae bacterium]MDZ4156036.1 sulfate ABC transporter substrate-binding protein [Methylococcales bacterium]